MEQLLAGLAERRITMSIFHYIQSGISFAAFFSACILLIQPQLSKYQRWKPAFWTLAGILLFQAGLLLTGQETLLFTLLPVSAYLPMILCFHFLSAMSFFQTCIAWIIGFLIRFILEFLCKTLSTYSVIAFRSFGMPGWQFHILVIVIQLFTAVGLVLIVFYRIRKPFHHYTKGMEKLWITLLLPCLLAFLLLSYFFNSLVNPTVLILTLLISLSLFFILAQILILTVSLGETRKAEQAAQWKLEMLRRDYHSIQQKIELSRVYRHDMRHHLAALDEMLQRNDNEDAKQYILDLKEKLVGLTRPTWCRNTAVNAVLGAYIEQAQEKNCQVSTHISIPADLPFDETDLCVVIANALENAVHACQKLPEGPHTIQLEMELTRNQRLTISVSNPCPQPVTFDSDGFPAVPPRKGHGLGLRSIRTVADKYGGLFRCQWEAGSFSLQVVLFPPARELPVHPASRPKRAAAVITGLLFCLVLVNSSPGLASALEAVPVLGPVIHVMDWRSYFSGWGDSELAVSQPKLAGEGLTSEASSSLQEANSQIEAFVSQMEKQFLWYASRKYNGYTSIDMDYSVLRDDSALFILRFYAVINAGGSVEYSRYVVWDKAAARILTLKDLFLPEANYIFPISREIKAQMSEQINAGKGAYFLPGGIWREEECFQAIDADQDFYIDSNNHLVIAFEAYTVAPGSMGNPEFVIPASCLGGLLAEPSLLK